VPQVWVFPFRRFFYRLVISRVFPRLVVSGYLFQRLVPDGSVQHLVPRSEDFAILQDHTGDGLGQRRLQADESQPEL